MIKHSKTGAVILPTLLLLSSMTLAISLSFSFYSTSGVQVVSRNLRSAEALAASQSGVDDGIRRVLRIFLYLPTGGIAAAAQLRAGLDALDSYTFTTLYADGHENTTHIEICYNLALWSLGTIDECSGEVALGKIRVHSTGQFNSPGAARDVYRKLEAILSLDPLTSQITIDSIKEIAFVLPVPDAPSDLAGNAVSSSQIDLTWTDNSDDEISFTLQRSLSEDSGFSTVATLDPDTTSYSNTGLAGDTTYYYRIKSTNSFGDSAYSDTVEVIIGAFPPDAPSGLTLGSYSASQVTVSWTDNSNNEDAFIVQRSTDGSTYSTVATTSVNALSYSDTSVSAMAFYYYRVKAVNGTGDSAYTGVVNVMTPPPACGGGECLILYWPFDEGSGTTINDSSGYGYTGKTYASPTWISGKKNGALSFSGSARVEETHNVAHTVINVTDTFSVSMWIKPTTTRAGHYFLWPTHGMSWTRGSNDYVADRGMGVSAGTDGVCVVTHTGGSAPCIINWNGSITSSDWTHIVVTFGGGTAKLYVDSVLQSSVSAGANVHPGSGGYDRYYHSGGVGGGPWGNSAGSVDEFRIYNKTLNQSEVNNLYNNP